MFKEQLNSEMVLQKTQESISLHPDFSVAVLIDYIAFVVMLGLIAVALPAALFWEGEVHFNFVFGMAPRIVVASLMAFLVGSFLNSYVMSRMKVASGGRNFSVRVVKVIKRVDGSDVYDEGISYNILKIKDI